MRVYLKNGYRSQIKTNGIHYPKGVHDFDDDLAQYLIETGHGQAVDQVIEEVLPEPERDVHITEGAQALMESFDLSVDDFPDVERIDKPMVDAFLANQMAANEDDETSD